MCDAMSKSALYTALLGLKPWHVARMHHAEDGKRIAFFTDGTTAIGTGRPSPL